LAGAIALGFVEALVQRRTQLPPSVKENMAHGDHHIIGNQKARDPRTFLARAIHRTNRRAKLAYL
jgi:hypothetical protein